MLNAMATQRGAAEACPNTRVVAKPPAAPLRARGAADSMARLFGARKKQSPRPRHAGHDGLPDTEAGNRVSRCMPATMVAAPTPLKVVAE